MKIFKDKHTLQKEILKTKGISFVPTMGGLHKGHISLIKQSKKSKFKTLVSIFVNPKQFNKKSDYKSYPRNTKKDIKLLKKLKIDYLYIPTFKDIYGFKPKNKVFLDKFSKKLCGKFRKGHFEGVLNVVNRFIEIISALQSGALEISSNENNEIEISSPKGVYKIMGKEPSEYPETPSLEKTHEVKIKGNELIDIINNTLYAVSKDDLKPALCGIYFNINKNQIMSVATDGHRLVKFNKKIKDNNPEASIIIPGKFFSILKKQSKKIMIYL